MGISPAITVALSRRKPGTRMPRYPLTGQEIADLTRYLDGLK